MQLYKKQKNVSQFFFFFYQFLKSTPNIAHFGKKMTLRVYLFPKLETAKDVVRKMSNKPRFRTLFDS